MMLIKLDNGDYINTDMIVCIAGGDKKSKLVIGLVPRRILFWKSPRLITMPMTGEDKERIVKAMSPKIAMTLGRDGKPTPQTFTVDGQAYALMAYTPITDDGKHETRD